MRAWERRPEDASLWTRAERTEFRETSRHAEVEALCRLLARRSRRVRVESMGRSGEDRDMPVLVLSSGGASTPAAAKRLGRAVVLVQANIHAGEVEGKESVLALARELALAPKEPALLRRLTLVLVPDFNPDGNDRISTANRALDMARMEGQIGPPGGVGTRYTGAGWNLNRDAVKHDAVEMRNMARLFRRWAPHLFLDCHTTDGSIHGFPLTFDTAHNPLSGDPGPIALVRDSFLPEVARRLRKRTGLETGFYGNFKDHADPAAGWETYPALPRFGSHYRGLCGRPDILLETYSYIDFEARCRVMLEILREITSLAAERAADLRAAVEDAERRTVAAGLDPRPGDRVGVDYGVARRDAEGNLLFDYPCHPEGSIVVPSGTPAEIREHRLPAPGRRLRRWRVPHIRRFVPTRSVQRPFAYLAPASLAERLEGHGIRFRALRAARRFEVEEYRVLAMERTHSPDVAGPVPPPGEAELSPKTPRPPRRFETVFTVRPERATREAPAGTLLVPTAQALGNLAIYLLEPESDDGFARWGYLDAASRPGGVFPVLRVPRPVRG